MRKTRIVVAGRYDQAREFMQRFGYSPADCIVPFRVEHILGLQGLPVHYCGTWNQARPELLQELASLIERGRLSLARDPARSEFRDG